MKRVPLTKKIENAGVIEVARVINELGWVWRPTPNDDYGLDGEIEPVTDGSPTGKIIKVQVKSGKSYFKREDAISFEFLTSESDLKYWNSVNVPVALIVHDPVDKQTYWMEVQRYLRTHPDALKSRLIKFDKQQDLFGTSSEAHLVGVAMDETVSGRIFRRRSFQETLHSNLLPLSQMPKLIYSAPTECSQDQEIRDKLGSAPKTPAIIREKRLWTFSNLSDEKSSLRLVCDPSDTKTIKPIEWSGDNDRKQWLVALMNSCLRKKCAALGLIYDPAHGRYYFPPLDGGIRVIEYQSLQKKVRNPVVYRHTDKLTNRVDYWVHWAVRLRFVNYGLTWYLMVLPSFVFTKDGQQFVASELVGRLSTRRKSHQYNRNVLGFLAFWRDYLSSGQTRIVIYPAPHPQTLAVSKIYLSGQTTFGIEGDKVKVRSIYEDIDEIDIEAMAEEETGNLEQMESEAPEDFNANEDQDAADQD